MFRLKKYSPLTINNKTDMNKNTLLNSDFSSIQEPITNASPEVKQVIEEVLKIEKDKLYLKTPRNVNEDVLNIIKQVVQ